jgi:septal ring factor EnvC (AmiA/AmiB activator)
MRAISLVIILLLIGSAMAFGQNRSSLEKKRKALLKNIDMTTKMLQQTRKSKQASLGELETLQKQIRDRRALINNLRKQVAIYQRSIDQNRKLINALEQDLEKLKEEYGKMIYYAYKNQGSYNKVLFIFSSTSFNEAYKRINYLKQYTEHRKEQAAMIVRTQQDLNEKNESLKATIKSKRALISSESDQKRQLDVEKNTKDILVETLKKEESKLRRKIDLDKKAADKLNKMIEEIIRKEIAAAKKDKGGNNLKMTPEALKLSANFAGNKGALPWPVERGVITKSFGEHPHPVLPGIKEQNNGVDIKTATNATIRVVFEGEVAEVFYNPSFKNAVMIRHGEYFTVYTGLKEVYVKKGDKVTTKQTIGIIHTDSEGANSQLHFEIWKGFTKMNPAQWIFRK